MPQNITYAVRLRQMCLAFRAELNEPELPFVVGHIGPFLSPADYRYAPSVRAALADRPKQLPHTGFADSIGLQDKGDKLHFDATSARELGTRFAAAWLALHRNPEQTPATPLPTARPH